jgi:hypothetical protein
MDTDGHGLRGGAGEKRQRAAAVQNLAEMRSGPANAKRLGLRQSSGALERGNDHSEFRKLDAVTALASSGALPENVNYAVKSSFLLSFLESVPEISAKLKSPITADRKFEDVVKSAQDAAVLVLVY